MDFEIKRKKENRDGNIIGDSFNWLEGNKYLVGRYLVPWTYSLYFIWKINKSGVERWGAKPAKIKEKELSQ